MLQNLNQASSLIEVTKSLILENLNAEIIIQSNYPEKDGIGVFSPICSEVLKKHAPKKQRYVRANHKTIHQYRNF